MSIQKENINSTLEQTLQAIKLWRELFGVYQEDDIVQLFDGSIGRIRGTSHGWDPVLYAIANLKTDRFMGWYPVSSFKFIRISDKKLEELQRKRLSAL